MLKKETSVYFLPGRGEKFGDQLAQAIISKNDCVKGRELTFSFFGLPFEDQIWIIQEDLKHFWSPAGVLIARSFGAYLLLHALAPLEAFPGRALLFSPILGATISKREGLRFIPPRARKLREMIENRLFPALSWLEIHVGENDEQCDLELIAKLVASMDKASFSKISKLGHDFPPLTLDKILDDFFRIEETEKP